MKQLLGRISWQRDSPGGKGCLHQSGAVHPPRRYPAPLVGAAGEVLQRPALSRFASGGGGSLGHRPNGTCRDAPSPAIRETDRIRVQEDAGAKRKLQVGRSDSHGGAVTPAGGPRPPLVNRNVVTLVQIPGVDPAIVPIEVGTDAAPLPAA